MAVTIQEKHSVTTDAVPLVEELQLGQFALNAADGKVFIKTVESDVIDLLSYTFADGGEIT